MRIDWWTFVLQGINFLVLVWLLWRVLYRPVKRIIEKRKEVADQALAEAEAAKREAVAEKKKFEDARSKVAQERGEMVKSAHEEIEAARRTTLDRARADAEQIVAEARRKVAEERRTTLADLRTEIVGLAADLAGKMLQGAGETLNGDVFLDQLEIRLKNLPAEERARLAADATAEDARLTITTAAPLDRTAQARWRERLAASLDAEPPMEFATDAALIGGAQLHFPHAVLSCSWADQLRDAETLLRRDDEPA